MGERKLYTYTHTVELFDVKVNWEREREREKNGLQKRFLLKKRKDEYFLHAVYNIVY